MGKITAMVPILIMCSALLSAPGCGIIFGPDDMIRGTVKYIDVEGGFYGLVGDDGTHYDPMCLSEAFRHDGLRVKFTGKVREDLCNFHMWGWIFEIDRIERLHRPPHLGQSIGSAS